jgi:hypothetical protein
LAPREPLLLPMRVLDGRVYAISLDDGRTLWIGHNPGGSSNFFVQ